jgi:hypothetical protein
MSTTPKMPASIAPLIQGRMISPSMA